MSNKLNLTIGHLYGKQMNTYGDDGNIIALKKRCQWRNIDVKVIDLEIGYKLEKGEVDLFFFGGGQDQAQELVSKDLVSSLKRRVIKEEVERGVPLLSICGGYQLLGEYYQPHKGPKLMGLGLFPTYTIASHDRMIGNIVIQLPAISLQLSDKKKDPDPLRLVGDEASPKAGEASDRRLMTDDWLVGFENHSGKTYLKEGAQPLGKIVKGFGNNGEDKTEGCVYKNAIGSYMHGSLLPKNPHLADWLIQKALETKYHKKITLKPLEDGLEWSTHQAAIQRFG